MQNFVHLDSQWRTIILKRRNFSTNAKSFYPGLSGVLSYQAKRLNAFNRLFQRKRPLLDPHAKTRGGNPYQVNCLRLYENRHRNGNAAKQA